MAIERIELLVPAECYSSMTDIENLSRIINNKINEDLGAKLTEILGSEKEVIASLGKHYSSFIDSTNTIKFMQDLSWQPLVRCKDCRYNSDNNDSDNDGWCYKNGIYIIGFCSEGEL